MATPLILTRPHHQSMEFWAHVAAHCPGKFEPVLTPLLEIRPELASVDLTNVQAILFTSRNGVDLFGQISSRRDVLALCVGARTAAAAQMLGMSASNAGADAAALASLAAMSYVPEAGHFLHLRGAHATGDIASALAAEGIPVEEQILYDQIALDLTDEAKAVLAAKSCVVPLFSPRTATAFVDGLGGMTPPDLRFVAISHNTASPLRSLNSGIVVVAERPDVPSMLDCIAAL